MMCKIPDRLKCQLVVCVVSSCFWGTVRAAEPAARSRRKRRPSATRMQWWREARFGMFVHWGLYSGLAGTWDGKPVGTRGGMEWIQQRVKADTDTYAKARHPAVQAHARTSPASGPGWPRKPAAATWCSPPSTTTASPCTTRRWATTTPAPCCTAIWSRRSSTAARAEGLRVGFYHSVIDWHHDQYAYARSKQLPHPLHGQPYPNGERDHAKYVDYLHAQVNELVSNYGPVDVLWWDYSSQDFQGDEAWRASDLMRLVRDQAAGDHHEQPPVPHPGGRLDRHGHRLLSPPQLDPQVRRLHHARAAHPGHRHARRGLGNLHDA